MPHLSGSLLTHRQLDISEDDAQQEDHLFLVEVVLTNMGNTAFGSAFFLLPSPEPITDLSRYRAVYNNSTACYEVVARDIGRHNYNPMTIPFAFSRDETVIEDNEPKATLEVSISTTEEIPAVTINEAENEDPSSHDAPLATSVQVMATELTPGYYRSPTGEDWAAIDEDVHSPSGSGSLSDGEHGNAAPHPTTSTNAYIKGNNFTEAESQDSSYGGQSREIIALDLDGVPAKRASNGWSKGTCVEALDLRLRDVNRTTLAEWFADNDHPFSEPDYTDSHSQPAEGSVIDHDEGSSDHQNSRKAGVSDLPNLRQYIPADTCQDVQFALQHSLEYFKNDYVRNQWAQGQVDWFYMIQASRSLLASGKSQRRPLFEETGRSAGRTARPRMVDSAPAETESRRVHHYNFNAKPVYRKSTTPPAVSYWVTTSPALKEWNDYTGSLHQIVVSSQAAKYVDPYLYHGPQIAGILEGTALQEHVTGHVEKVYSSHGNWSEDNLDVDDDRPADGGETPVCINSRCAGLNLLPRPYEGSAANGDPLVNDDGRRHPPALSKDRQVVGRPSWLSFIENAYDVEDELNSETPPVTVPDTVSMGEEVFPGVVQEQAVSDEEDTIEPPEEANAAQSSLDTCPHMTAWLAKIHHLSSLPIEEKMAFLYEAWSPPSKACSQNRQDLAKWSEQPESPSKWHHDLAKWSEEPEGVINQQQGSDVFLPGEVEDDCGSCLEICEPVGNRDSGAGGIFADEAVADLAIYGSGHVLNPQPVVHIASYVDTDEVDKHHSDLQLRTMSNTDQSHHEDSGLSFESGKDIIFKVLKESGDNVDVKSGKDGVLSNLGPEQDHAAPTGLTDNSAAVCFKVGRASEAEPDNLDIVGHAIAISLDDSSNFSVGRIPEDNCIAVQEIDKCLHDIKELMSPLHFDTTKCSPFQRPDVALRCYSELSINDEWSSKQELDNSSLKLSDIIYDEWSTSSEDDSSGTKDKHKQVNDSSEPSDEMSIRSVSPSSFQGELVFSQIHVIYDAAGAPDVDYVGLHTIVEGPREATSDELEPAEEMIREEVKVDGDLALAQASGAHVGQVPEQVHSDGLDTGEEDIFGMSVKPAASISSAIVHAEDPKETECCMDKDSPKVGEIEVQGDSMKLEGDALIYLDAATQTEELVCNVEVVSPADPSPTHFDCSGLFNISMPKINLTDCLIYGGAALYLGHQAYRALRR